MSRASDSSSQHFDWLVENRSRNQRSAVALYSSIETHDELLKATSLFQFLAQDLVAVAFSLWRAVFLGDLTGDLGDQLADTRSFLRSLIAHNTVLYQTDFNAREWGFAYYLENAKHRLDAIASSHSSILATREASTKIISAKDDWSNAQASLDLAIANFAKVLDAHDPA